jgi:serine protease
MSETTQAPFVAGEFIIRFRPQVSLASVSRLSVLGAELEQVRPLALEGAFLYRGRLSHRDTMRALQALHSRGDLVYAQLNYIVESQRIPNDRYYSLQRWHYEAIRLPQAWSLETGASNPVTVAVIDGGIYSRHLDFAGKLLPGYDFVSDPARAGDGDGRDPDPEDTSPTNRDFHGTHVAGTVAAATNNNLGVAGVSWGASIVPVRAVSDGTGPMTDVIDALVWAAGLPVAGVPPNPHPARVINMSLGVNVSCTAIPALQSAITAAGATGASIVVAAGNSGADARNFSPASCTGVITVGATNALGQRASYSNCGTRIDLMAPGGDSLAPVFSTLGNQQYGGMAGTSMAAPHVAGVLALMKSRRPGLTTEEGLRILKETAWPLTPAECGHPSQYCGAGLVDAGAALSRGTAQR